MLWVYFALGLSTGVTIGIAINKYISPYLDILLEKFSYRQSVECTKYKLAADTLAVEFELAYSENNTNVIGFEYAPPEDQFDEDDDEIEDKKFGFQSPKIN